MSADLLRLTAAVILVGTFSFYLYQFRAEIKVFFEETLVQLFKSVFADKNTKALFGVFYKFNHSDAEEWINWIKSGDKNVQDRAFDRIVKYLEKESRDIGTVIKDISKAVLSLDREESYDVFEDLLHRSRKEWSNHKTKSSCYEQASLNLMKVDEAQAQDLLMQEFSEIGDGKEDRQFKRHVLSALALMKDEKKLTSFYKDVALDYSNEIDIRILTLNALEDKGDTELYFEYLIDLINSLIDDGISNHQDMLTVCFSRYLDSINGTERHDEAWKNINEFCKNEELAPLVCQAFCEKIKSKDFDLDKKWLMIIYLNLNAENREMLDQVLMYHFTITEREKELLAIEKRYQVFAQQLELDNKTNFKDLEPNTNFKLFDHVNQLYPDFETAVDTPSRSIRVITGSASKDKLFMAQQYAIKKKQTTMCINADLLMLSPDLVSKIDKLVTDEYKLIYVYNTMEFMTKITDGSNDGLAKNILSLAAKLNMNRELNVIISLDKDMADLAKTAPKLHEALEKGGQFAKVHEIGSFDHRKKKEIYVEYKAFLKEDRENHVTHEMLDQHSKPRGCVEFMQYMFEILTRSLMTQGEIIPLDKYDEYMAYNS